MKATLKNNELTIDLRELVDSLTDEDRAAFAEHAVFQKKLFEAVLDTVANGNCFDGGWWCCGLDQKLRLKLLPLLPQAMTNLVRGLLTDIAREKALHEQATDALRKAMNHWPQDLPSPVKEYWRDLDYRTITADEADAYIGKILGAEAWAEIKAKNAPAVPVEAEI